MDFCAHKLENKSVIRNTARIGTVLSFRLIASWTRLELYYTQPPNEIDVHKLLIFVLPVCYLRLFQSVVWTV